MHLTLVHVRLNYKIFPHLNVSNIGVTLLVKRVNMYIECILTALQRIPLKEEGERTRDSSGGTSQCGREEDNHRGVY